VSYLVDQFRKLGLKPGNGDSFLQQFPRRDSRRNRRVAVGKRPRRTLKSVLRQGHGHLEQTSRTPGGSQGQRAGVRGYGIVAPDYAWNDYADVDVHGKTVVLLASDQDSAPRTRSIQGGHDLLQPRGLQNRRGRETGAAGC